MLTILPNTYFAAKLLVRFNNREGVYLTLNRPTKNGCVECPDVLIAAKDEKAN